MRASTGRILAVTMWALGQVHHTMAQSHSNEQPVKPEWLAVNCSRMDMTPTDFGRCVEAMGAALEPLDTKRRDLFGESYNPKKYVECRKQYGMGYSNCEYLALRRRPQPEFWPFPDMPRPKLPSPPEKSVYRPWMSAKQYYEALCKSEAGEFTYRTVDGVVSVYELRPRLLATDDEIRDRYVLEDPYGHTQGEAERAEFSFVGPGKYEFFESPVTGRRKPLELMRFYDGSLYEPPGASDKVHRYSGYGGGDFKQMKMVYASTPQSKYGYVWREIARPNDRKLGIVGGELIVLDLRTGEILGLRRGFAISGFVTNVPSGFQWEFAAVCPANLVRPDLHKSPDFSYQFIRKVLKPVR
jgi:hypothetical protein